MKGTDDIEVPVKDGKYIKEAKIGRAIMDADVFISLTHFKGHEMTGFGGAIKNIGMGCGSRAGKKDQHNDGKPSIDPEKCRGCRRCLQECANQGLEFDAASKKMQVNQNHCVGCGRCLGACNFDAIAFDSSAALSDLKDVYKRQFITGFTENFFVLCSANSSNCGPAGKGNPSIFPTRSTACPAFKSRDPVIF